MEEVSPLLTEEGLSSPPTAPRRFAPVVRKAVLYLAAVSAVAAVSGLWRMRVVPAKPTGLVDVCTSGTVTDCFFVTATNEYPAVTSAPWWTDEGYVLVEPHRTTTLSIADASGAALTDGAVVKWKIAQGAPGAAQTYELTGTTVKFEFESGSTEMTIDVRVYQNSKVSFMKVPILRKYVRREIRILSDTDRENFFEAMRETYFISPEEGRARYGEEFKTIRHYVRMHLYGAAALECDHWHDGAGIMTHHIAFTWMYERNLQLINPSVTVPYWDYTYDALKLKSNWEDSIIFDDDWFGKASPSDKHHIITSGRFAYTPVMEDAGDYSNITNSYGLLRSPWNTNPTPYIMRHHETLGQMAYVNGFPDCSDFATAFNSTNLGRIFYELNGQTHGPVHILIGGEWDQAMVDTTSASTLGVWHKKYDKYRKNFAKMAWGASAKDFLLISKTFWRYGVTRCPKFDKSDLVPDGFGFNNTRSCFVPEEIREKYTDYELLTEVSPVLHWIDNLADSMHFDPSSKEYHMENFTVEEETLFWSYLVDALQDPGHPGEMYTSAAPYDPTFWPLHTFAERFLQLRRLYSYYGLFKLDETWSYVFSSAPSDTHQVCDWQGLDYHDFSTMPSCEYSICPGHNGDDDIPFGNLVGKTSVTNKEFYDFITPLNKALPYMYDNYRADHCLEEGVSFSPENWHFFPGADPNNYMADIDQRLLKLFR